MTARLDAEGSDAFDLQLDRIPAVNGAQHMVMSAVSAMFERNKRLAESLRDLRSDEVFQSDIHGHLPLDSLLEASGKKKWTIIAVHPEFHSAPSGTVDADTELAIPRPDIRFIYPVKSAKFYTGEQWSMALEDVFAQGSPKYTGSEKSYGYTHVHSASNSTDQGTAITILSVNVASLIAVSYLRVPKDVPDTVATDPSVYDSYQLEWPDSMKELLAAVALRTITQKQGDGTTVNSLNAQEQAMLLQALV